MFSEDELKALRYYEGDTEGDDPFWSDPKAYLTLNSLLYPGIGSETARSAEGKRLNPAVTEDPERLLEVYRCLISALYKGRKSAQRTVYRVERWSDHLAQRYAGMTLSFTSTSTAGFLDAYRDRIGIALLEIIIPAGIPALDFAEALPYYAKAEEREILLPPYMSLTYQDEPLTEQEGLITDAAGEGPRGKCRVIISGPADLPAEETILPNDSCAERVYASLNRGETPDEEDVSGYLRYKEALQKQVINCLKRIYRR